MAKRKGLPKKYAKMGFKKGWAAYKKVRGTTRRKPTTRGKTRVRRTGRKTMAKRKYTRRSNSMGPIINGVLGGIAAEAGQKLGGGLGAGAATLAVGYLMKNATLKTVGAYQLGSYLGDQLPVIGGGGSVAGGAFE